MRYVSPMVRIAAAFLLALATALTAGAATADDRPLTVVELYTSQGCNSCPPADAFLGELAERDDLLALSFHVDYWDYIGWKDPFASRAHSDRQRQYAARFGMRYVYTPQMVIDGVAQVTGSDRSAVLAGIKKAQGRDPVPVAIEATGSGSVTVTVGAGNAGGPADVWLVVFDREHATDVRRGENRGRNLRNFNVVRRFERLATWHGEALTIPAAMSEGSVASDACGVIVQEQRSGHVLGAASLSLAATR